MERTLQNDARNRAIRTFVQGLAANILVAVALIVLPIFTSATGWQDIDWKIMGFLVVQTVVVTVLSYLMRAFTKVLPPPPTPAVANPDGSHTITDVPPQP